MIDSFGDVGTVIEQARPDSLARLYRDLRARHATGTRSTVGKRSPGPAVDERSQLSRLPIAAHDHCGREWAVSAGTRSPAGRIPASVIEACEKAAG